MASKSSFLDAVPIPIIQGPMLGASTEAMAVAVSGAGGLGSFAASSLDPAGVKAACQRLKAATDRLFAINLFIQYPETPSPESLRRAMDLLRPWRQELGLPEQAIPNTWAEAFLPQFDALLEAAPPVASFTFGILTAEQAAALKARGILLVGTATTVAEAKAWAAIGADAICAQGFEAGGHRGTFLKSVAESQVGTLALVGGVREAVELPVIAAGGIADGKAIAAALALGASAVQIGTAYLLSDESGISSPWKKALVEAEPDATRLTRAFSGRHARGIENRFLREMAAHDAVIPPYPIQNALTQELRTAAAKSGNAEMLSLWAGQSHTFARSGASADITQSLWREAQAALSASARRWTKAP
jgi:nitronate monooxygenase